MAPDARTAATWGVMRPAYLSSAWRSSFGDLGPADALDLMTMAAIGACTDAGTVLPAIDGLLVGYAVVMPHLMPATRMAELWAMTPRWAASLSMGGASGLAMVQQAALLVGCGYCDSVLVVAGENRRSAGLRSQTARALAGVGHPQAESPYGLEVPAYYGLLASAYCARTGASPERLAELAVLMRRHASATHGAHYTERVSVQDVRNSRPIASPLHLLDCCPVSDGAAAVLVSARPGAGRPLLIAGSGQAHRHQHLTMMDLSNSGAGDSFACALASAGVTSDQIGLLLIYDSFTVTLAILLEELGFSAAGAAGKDAAEGRYGLEGPHPLNPHGGLLSYGHAGVAGGLAAVVEAQLQGSARAEGRQVRTGDAILVHAEGGILSAHVSMILLPQ